MWLQSTFFLFQYILLSSKYYYIIGKPMFGDGVRVGRNNEFPYAVALMQINEELTDWEEKFICTGTLVTKRDVLTAAHCFEEQNLNNVVIYAGTSDVRIATHYLPLWWITFNEWASIANVQPQHRINDIASIRLCIEVCHNFEPPILSSLTYQQLYGQNITIAGWGMDFNDIIPPLIHTVILKVLSTADCRNRVSRLHGSRIKIHERHICSIADPPAIMYFGDSGAPVMHANKFIAIHRATIPFADDPKNIRKINIHNSIDFYRNFILAVIDPNFVYI